jgi:hypothetical protein
MSESDDVPRSAYPQVIVYALDGAPRRVIDCVPTTRTGLYLVNEPLDCAEGEAVVLAFQAAEAGEPPPFADLRAAH